MRRRTYAIPLKKKGPRQARAFSFVSLNVTKLPTARIAPDSAQIHSCTAASRTNTSGRRTVSDVECPCRQLSFHKPDRLPLNYSLRNINHIRILNGMSGSSARVIPVNRSAGVPPAVARASCPRDLECCHPQGNRETLRRRVPHFWPPLPEVGRSGPSF